MTSQQGGWEQWANWAEKQKARLRTTVGQFHDCSYFVVRRRADVRRYTGCRQATGQGGCAHQMEEIVGVRDVGSLPVLARSLAGQ